MATPTVVQIEPRDGSASQGLSLSDETEYEVPGSVMIAHVHIAFYHAGRGESQRSA